MNGPKRFLKGLAKEMDVREPFIKKANQRDINNLWSGYEFGGKAKTTAAVAALGYGGYKIHQQPFEAIRQDAEAQDVQSLPGTRGDMTGYTAFPGQETGLETSGDLVFALHKLRHGG